MAEAFDVLDQEDVAGAEGAGLAGRGDLDAAGDADDEMATVLGLLGVAAAGRAVAEQDRGGRPWMETLIASGGGSSGTRGISMSSNRA